MIMKKIPNALALKLLMEHENTKKSVKDLCAEHNVDESTLYQNPLWFNKAPKPAKTELVLSTPSTDIVIDTDHTKLLEDITTIKTRIVNIATDLVNTMDRQGAFIDVKELKDITTLVDTVEKSIKPQTPTESRTVVNIIQNIMNNFKDDC